MTSLTKPGVVFDHAEPAREKTIWSLQSLRFAAAMMAVYVHAAESAFSIAGSEGFLLHKLQVVGQAGVDIFFVLSGVIIATTARKFAWREFA